MESRPKSPVKQPAAVDSDQGSPTPARRGRKSRVVESDSEEEELTRKRTKKRTIQEMSESEEVMPSRKSRRGQGASGITPVMEKLSLEEKKKVPTSPIKDLASI